MTEPTSNAKAFMWANDKSKVVSGAAHGLGRGGTYTLKNGRSFHLSVQDCRSLPEEYPKWHWPSEIPDAPEPASEEERGA